MATRKAKLLRATIGFIAYVDGVPVHVAAGEPVRSDHPVAKLAKAYLVEPEEKART
jgi:hypothetical protein